VREPGEIRRRDDGTFEYLKSTSVSLKGGYVEEWESVVVHAARHMQLPRPFLDNLYAQGYRGGPHLYDLMIAEGWKAPERGYIELQDDTGKTVKRLAEGRDMPIHSRALAEEQTGEYIRQTLHEPTEHRHPEGDE
jgi:hypothetical protein